MRTLTTTATATPTPPAPPTPAGELDVHFIDVGQGDATLLLAPDATMLVDTGRHDATDVVDYLHTTSVETPRLGHLDHPDVPHRRQPRCSLPSTVTSQAHSLTLASWPRQPFALASLRPETVGFDTIESRRTLLIHELTINGHTCSLPR